jgi:hypothetical protein
MMVTTLTFSTLDNRHTEITLIWIIKAVTVYGIWKIFLSQYIVKHDIIFTAVSLNSLISVPLID